jgi:predicted DNA-binding protein (MmcQ/YjbR family)
MSAPSRPRAEVVLAKVREICLSLPCTREGDHFGSAAFYVKEKLFATCSAKHGACEITFGLQSDHAAALVAKDPRFKPYARDKRGVVLDAATVTNWSEVAALLAESYELQMPPPARKRAVKKAAPSGRTKP